MTSRSSMKLPFPVFALAVIALLAVPITIAAANDSRIPLAPRVNFVSTPVWETIPGTSVFSVRDQERPSYDMFRYGSMYYIYNDGYWYRSSGLNRKFAFIDERHVPMAFAGIPNDHWRTYPVGWTNPKNPHFSGRHDNGHRAVKPAGNGNHGKKGR